jgi:hypothetical protein
VAAGRAGLSCSRYEQARERLVARGLLAVEEGATGRGRASTVALVFADTGPWWEGDINVELLERVLDHSAARGAARLLLAAMAALADEHGEVREVCAEELCAAAGISDRTYRRACACLLTSGDVELAGNGGGRSNMNVWVVRELGERAALETPAKTPAETPAKTPAETPAETPAKVWAPNTRAGKEPLNPRTSKDPPNPPRGGSSPDAILIEERHVTANGRKRRRAVRVDLDEVRRELGIPCAADRNDWERIREAVGELVGESTFEIWLAPLELIAIDPAGTLVLVAPAATSRWIEQRFARPLARCGEQHSRAASR